MRVEKRKRSERFPSKEELIIRTSGSGDLLPRSLPSINDHVVDSWTGSGETNDVQTSGGDGHGAGGGSGEGKRVCVIDES